jgi:hypothetical protein
MAKRLYAVGVCRCFKISDITPKKTSRKPIVFYLQQREYLVATPIVLPIGVSEYIRAKSSTKKEEEHPHEKRK